MNAKSSFLQASYAKMKAAISAISPADKADVYALSFWYYNYNDDPRYPKIAISYNTRAHFESQIDDASSESEAKWNYAFWLQNDIEEIGGEEDELLQAWFRETPYYYTDAEEEKAQEDEALFDKLTDQGSAFDKLFVEEIIMLTQMLFSEGIVAAEFGSNTPVLVHELEYYEVPIDWTIRANPAGLVDEFVTAFRNGAL